MGTACLFPITASTAPDACESKFKTEGATDSLSMGSTNRGVAVGISNHMMLTKPTIDMLNDLHFRSDARRIVLAIPLGSICWDDELPSLRNLAMLSQDEQNIIWSIFGIRFKLWDGVLLSQEERQLWGEVQAGAPNWPLFCRITLSPEDRIARLAAEREVESELVELFDRADAVQIGENGGGLQSFSATFNLTDDPPE